LSTEALEGWDPEKGEPKFNSTKILNSRVRPRNWRFDPGARLLAHAASELSPECRESAAGGWCGRVREAVMAAMRGEATAEQAQLADIRADKI
jgi:hypothetical protein